MQRIRKIGVEAHCLIVEASWTAIFCVDDDVAGKLLRDAAGAAHLRIARGSTARAVRVRGTIDEVEAVARALESITLRLAMHAEAEAAVRSGLWERNGKRERG